MTAPRERTVPSAGVDRSASIASSNSRDMVNVMRGPRSSRPFARFISAWRCRWQRGHSQTTSSGLL